MYYLVLVPIVCVLVYRIERYIRRYATLSTSLVFHTRDCVYLNSSRGRSSGKPKWRWTYSFRLPPGKTPCARCIPVTSMAMMMNWPKQTWVIDTEGRESLREIAAIHFPSGRFMYQTKPTTDVPQTSVSKDKTKPTTDILKGKTRSTTDVPQTSVSKGKTRPTADVPQTSVPQGKTKPTTDVPEASVPQGKTKPTTDVPQSNDSAAHWWKEFRNELIQQIQPNEPVLIVIHGSSHDVELLNRMYSSYTGAPFSAFFPSTWHVVDSAVWFRKWLPGLRSYQFAACMRTMLDTKDTVPDVISREIQNKDLKHEMLKTPKLHTAIVDAGLLWACMHRAKQRF